MSDNLELLHDRYARALFECAKTDGTTDKIMEELEVLSNEWLEDEEFDRFLLHPLVSPSEKKEVIESLARHKKYDRTILDFLKVLIDNRRENLLHAVFLRYKDLYDRHKERIRVSVETACPFTKAEKYLLKDMLTMKFGEETEIEVIKRPELIGGMVIRYGDRVYDCSVKKHLAQLKKKITARETTGVWQESKKGAEG